MRKFFIALLLVGLCASVAEAAGACKGGKCSAYRTPVRKAVSKLRGR